MIAPKRALVWVAALVIPGLLVWLVTRLHVTLLSYGAVIAIAGVAALLLRNATLPTFPATLALIGAIAPVSPPAALGAAVIWTVTAVVRRKLLAGSALAAAALPLGVWLLEHPGPLPVLAVAVASALAFWAQLENVKQSGL